MSGTDLVHPEQVELPTARETMLSVESTRLLHELQVHQVELEMQNNELRLSRQELEASRERYFALFDMAPVGYLTLIGQGNILEANLTAASLLGVERPLLLSTSFTTYIHPEDRDLFCLQCRQLSELLLSQQWEMRMMRRGGSFFWAELKATPTRNNEFWIVLEDINRRKQAESLMYHQSRQMIHLILDNIPQRIFWKDRDCVYQGCNGCFAEDTGLANSQQVIGKTDFDLSWHERAEHYRKDDQLVMKADRPKLHYEESIKCADGTVLSITTSKVPLHDPHGSVIGVLCTYENITERKLALEELSKNAEQYRAMLATNLFGFWLVDLSGNILEVNDTYCRMSGYSREELLQYSISDVESAESSEETYRRIEYLITYGTGQFESKHRSKDGRIYDVEISTTYLRSQSKFIVFIRDISDRKQAEVALQESEARYHAIVEDQTDLICRYRPDGRLSFVNEPYLRCFDKERNEVINRNYIPHIPEPDLSRILKQLKGITPESPIVNVEHRVIKPDGVICWQHWVHRGIYSADNFIFEYQAVGRDITERKAAENALQESREKLKAYMDNSFDVIFVLTAEGVFQFVSRAWERHFGIPIKDVIGQNFALFVHPDDVLPCAEYLTRILAEGQSMTSPPYRVKRSDGSWRWFIANGSRYSDTNCVWQYIGVAHDVTEQYEAEEKLRQAKVTAESASQAKTAFLATMSHEIRTPLSALLGSIELLATTALLPQQQEYLKDCRTASKMLLNVINDVLDFSKIEAGKLEVVNEIFSVSSLARQLVRIFSVGAGQKGLDLVLSLADDLPRHISCDQHRLRQIISNLLSNAIKFTNNGTVSLKITSEQALSGTNSDSAILKISVCDTGIGIPPEKQDLIFDSFTQVENFSTRRHAGTGLGLAICRRLIEVMGGTVTLTSVPGEGSVFTVVLPVVVSHDAILIETNKHHLTQHGTSWSILLADDDELGRSVTKALLQRRGHRVSEAANGSELLEQLRKQRFDIVLSDISMPDMDGLEVARIIRSGSLSGIDPLIPVVAMTAHAFQNDVDSFLAAGFSSYASKPVNFESLLNSIDKLCSYK
ncbi:MAG: hypothetical protein A2076_15055 [Geobacteraceae bacterium GWC2_53_11]|nr:MAG: hypothetical protein A2076_15055 [Geobacteraceae bacterium GWC2_53_11]